MAKNHYVSGSWNLICDVCSKKIKASDAKQRWDGLVVCPDDFEHRHEQDYVRARVDKITVPFTRPRPPDAFILQHSLSDLVGISDDDLRDGYMEYSIENPYFAEDYIEQIRSFIIDMMWDRGFQDLLSNISETIDVDFSTGITDNITVSEDILVVREFLRSFTDSETLNDSNEISVDKPFVDSSLVSDSVSRLLTWSRDLSDTLLLLEQQTVTTTKALSDSISVTESFVASLHIIQSLVDSVSTTDSGFAVLMNYTEPNYFESDYVGEYTTF